MKNLIVVCIGILLTASSCLKEVGGTEELNTNIFDRDYAGGQWFEITEFYQYTNDLGSLKVRFEFIIPRENMPELEPSKVELYYEGTGVEPGVGDAQKVSGGDYKGAIELPYTGMDDTYCIELGIYISDEDASINNFEECRTL